MDIVEVTKMIPQADLGGIWAAIDFPQAQ